MRSTPLFSFVLFVPLFCGGRCQRFSKNDVALLKRHDGIYIPAGEGPARYRR